MKNLRAALVWSMLLGPLAFGQTFDLRILDKTAPAGGWAVMAVRQYEPRPIGSGQGCFTYGSTFFVEDPRLVVGNETGDATFQIEEFKPGSLLFSFLTLSEDFGLDGRPFIYIAMRVSPDAVEGSSAVLSFDPEGTFLVDSEGVAHTPEIIDGLFTVGGLSISCVYPKSGRVKAGQNVTITGVGFQSGSGVTFNGEKSTSVRFESENTLVAVAPVDFLSENVTVEVVNPDGYGDTFVMQRFGCLEDIDGYAGRLLQSK